MRITLEDWTDGVAIGGYNIANNCGIRITPPCLRVGNAGLKEELLLRLDRVSLTLKLNMKTKIMIVDCVKSLK